MQKFGLSIFFLQACAHVDEDLLIEWLQSCNPGLKGAIETIECREYKKTHPVVRQRGAKIITFTGDEEFLDSLNSFPSNFPFSIKIANAYIRGGDRVKERYAGGKSQRPRISQGALSDLLKRNSNMMADAAAEAEDRLADNLRRTDLHGNASSSTTPLLINKLTFQITHTNTTITLTLLFLTKQQDAIPRCPGAAQIDHPETETHTNTLYFFPSAKPRRDWSAILPEGHSKLAGSPAVSYNTSNLKKNLTHFSLLIILFIYLYKMFLINNINLPCCTDLQLTIKRKLYSAKMLIGHGIYPIGNSHEQRRHSWFSKSRVAPTAPEIRLGLGMGSTICRGYSGITFSIATDSVRLIVRLRIKRLRISYIRIKEIASGWVVPITAYTCRPDRTRLRRAKYKRE